MTRKSRLKFLKVALIEFGICLVLATGIIYGLQDSMIYHPRPYAAGDLAQSARQVEKIAYRTSQGDQTAFYAAPKDGGAAPRLWLMFGGNGGLILQYHPLTEQPALSGDGMLMVDYPGYGLDQGKPSGAAIQENAEAALAALAARLHTTREALLPQTGVFGHSLGTGVALEFALDHPQVRRVMLVAPFTSLYDMAFKVVGPVASLLHHNFDNEAVLKQLAARDPRPAVDIIAGDRDQVIPIAMSRKLKAENPWIAYDELPGYEHNHIVTDAAPLIAKTMTEMP